MKRILFFVLVWSLGWTDLLVEPEYTRIGETFTIKGEGFGENEDVLIEGANIKSRVVTNKEGEFSCEFIVPLIPGGEHIISATSLSKVEIGRIWVLPTLRLVPNSGKEGDEIEIFGIGYGPSERMQIGMGRHHLVAEAYTTPNGTFSTKFNVLAHPKGENRLFAIGHSTYLLAEEEFFVKENISLPSNEGFCDSYIALSGSGFMPNDEIRIDFGNIQTITTTIVGGEGNFNIDFNCPKFPGPAQIIKVFSKDFSETLPFFIKPRLVSSLPNRGYVFDAININIDGLIKDEVLTINFENRYETHTIKEDGIFSYKFIVETMPGGNKFITITSESGIFHTEIFQIRPKISFVTPLTPLTGESITFQGVGFQAGEKIRIDFGRREAILWINADEEGSFKASYVIQDPPGNYRLCAIGYTTYQAGIVDVRVIELQQEEEEEEEEEQEEEQEGEEQEEGK